MKRIIILMTLVLMVLSVIVAAENLCEKYYVTGKDCEAKVERYQQLTNPNTPEGRSAAKTCKKSGSGCVDELARAEAFGDRPLQKNEIQALTQLGTEVTSDTRFYQVRGQLYSPEGLKKLDSEAIAPPDLGETDQIIKYYRTGIPVMATSVTETGVEKTTVGYDDFGERLDNYLNPSGLMRISEKMSILVSHESHLPSGLTPSEEKAVKKEKAIVWLNEMTATIAEVGNGKAPLPESSIASLELSRKQFKTYLSGIKDPEVRKAAQELIRAFDATTSKFQSPEVKLQKLQQRLDVLNAIDKPIPEEEEEETDALMTQMDELKQVEPSQVEGIAVNPENLGKKVDWLKCPDGCDYKIQKGDSYWNLAKRIPDADIRMEALMEMNEGKPLVAGVTTIRIPSKNEFLDYAFKKEKFFSPFQCRG